MAEPPDRVRRRLDEVFGEVLPERTRDETGPDDELRGDVTEEELRANRPPHHDRA